MSVTVTAECRRTGARESWVFESSAGLLAPRQDRDDSGPRAHDPRGPHGTTVATLRLRSDAVRQGAIVSPSSRFVQHRAVRILAGSGQAPGTPAAPARNVIGNGGVQNGPGVTIVDQRY
jgi:hypothetical protein